MKGGSCAIAMIVYFTVLIKSSLEEHFRVKRSVEQNEFYYGSRDKFDIPASTCSHSNCSQFGSETLGNTCSCRCPFYKPSFVYRAGNWSCAVDDVIKNEEGCGFGETPMFYLETTTSSHIVVPEPNLPCSVIEKDSRYRDCDGTWRPIGKNRGFQMNEVSTRFDRKGYDIMIRAATGTPNIAGRIIKLVLTCNPDRGKPCFLFKINGRSECPVIPVNVRESATLTTTPASLPTTKESNRSTALINATKPTSREEVQNKGEKSDPREGPTVNVVAITSGVVVTLAVLIAVLFATVFIVRHRQKRNRQSTQNIDPENKTQHESQNMNDMFAQANPIYDGPKVQKGPPVKDRPPIPMFMRMSGKDAAQENPSKPPVKPRRKKKQHTGGNGKVCELAAKLRNSLASSLDNLPQANQKESAQESIPKKRKKPPVLPKPASRQKSDFEEESDDYDDYDSDEWDSFSEPEYPENQGVVSEHNVIPDTGEYTTQEGNDVIANGSAHTSNIRAGQRVPNGNHIYDSAEGIEGQRVSQPRKSELSRRISGMSADGHAVEAVESKREDEVDRYDEPEHIILR